MTKYCCFKYRNIDKRLIEQIINSAMYFPRRDQLNDPFDCNVDIFRAIDRAMSIEACARPDLLSKFEKDVKVIDNFKRNINELGIGSFSLTENETLLWAHYAGDHRGVVLRYDFHIEFLSDEDNILGVSAVSYEPNSISDWLAENSFLYDEDHEAFISGLLKKSLMAKAPAWQYEKEARIVRPNYGVFAFPRETLSHVIFGLHTSDQDEKLVRNLVDQYYDGVRFGRAIRSDDDFGIATVKL